jgi:6-phosphogluconolactonase
VPIPGHNILRIKGELVPEVAALGYEELLAATFGTEQPFLDLVFLGLGEDGHTLSLFPDTEALHDTGLVVANFIPKLDAWRITLTARAINDYARTVVFLVNGAAKADVLNKVLNGAYRPDELPAQLIDPQSGGLIWMVDRAAYPTK